MNEQDLKEMAAQFRKPSGEKGKEIGDFMNQGNEQMNLHTLAVLNPKPDDDILEIGMGNGLFVKNILNLHPSIKYTGCDFSKVMVEESIKNNIDFVNNGRAGFIETDANSIPLQDNSVNKIFTVNTLYFWEEVDKTLNEFKRVLKPGGELIISIRPKYILETYEVSQFGFTMFYISDVISILENSGFRAFEIFELKEPPLETPDAIYQRETLIVKCKI